MNAALLARAPRLLSPTAYWDFKAGDDPTKVYDRSGNGFDGTLASNDTLPAWTPTGLQLNGASQWVNLPVGGINLGPEHSILAVVTAAPGSSSDYRVITYTQQAATYFAVLPTSYAASALYDTAIKTSTSSPSKLTEGKPEFAFMRTSTAQAMTQAGLGGSFGVSRAFVPPAAPGASTIGTIGKRHNVSSYFWLGTLHAIVAYNRLLSDGEVSQARRALRQQMAKRGLAI